MYRLFVYLMKRLETLCENLIICNYSVERLAIPLELRNRLIYKRNWMRMRVRLRMLGKII